MEVDTISSLLKAWGFEKYTEVFLENEIDIEALKLLDALQISTLISLIGPQAKFKKQLCSWKAARQPAISKETNSEEEDILDNIVSLCEGSIPESPLSSAASTTGASYMSGDTPTSCDKNLIKLLEKTQDGKLLLRQRSQILGDQMRKLLTREIAREIVHADPKAPVTADVYLHWTNEISKVFPTENCSVYYTATTGAGRAHGRLYDAVTNLKAKYRRNNIYEPRARRCLDKTLTPKSAKSNHSLTLDIRDLIDTEDPQELNTQEIEECLEWLKSSVDNYALCAEKWKKTNQLRLQRVLSETEVQTYLKDFPCLKRSWGLHLVPNREESNVVIEIDELKVWTPEKKSWWRWKSNKTRNLILNNVSGSISKGEFAAVIGPSGAGKTTFLVSLAGKCTLPSEGMVTIRGRNIKELQGVVEIVPQFDIFVDSLSVQEHLVFMAEMKRGSCRKSSNQEVLNGIVKQLQLTAHTQTSIGALSGGERRLLSLATSALSNPQILICDEPTTGLDSYNAILVVDILKKMSKSGKIVICSVHQPSTDIFNEFNSILLMTEGKLLFHGSHAACKEFFESFNLICPKNYNPAEFYIGAVSNLNSERCNGLMESYHESRSHDDRGTSECTTGHTQLVIYRRNWFKQVHLLLWRSSLTLKRDLRKHFIQLFLSAMASSMVLGTCYVGISGTSQRGIQDIRGLLWLMTSEVSFSLSYAALYSFECELSLFRREVGLYSCTSYYVATFLCFIPRCIIWPATIVFITTLAVDLPNHIVTALEFITVLIFTSLASVAYGLGMGAIFTSTGAMGDVMPCADLPLFLMSGAFLRLSSLPFWMDPIKYVSHFYYGMDAMSNVYWRQIEKIDCPANFTTSCMRDGTAVLIESGYTNDFLLQDSLGLLIVTMLWSLLAYFGLKREEKKGYAY